MTDVDRLQAEVSQLRVELRRISTQQIRSELTSAQSDINTLESEVKKFTLLGEATADGTSSTLEVTSLPQTHRDLVVVVHGHNNGTTRRGITVRVNGDSGSNYRFIRILSVDNGSPTTVASQSATGWGVGAFGDGQQSSSLRLEIPDYSAATQHAMTSQSYATAGSAAGDSEHDSVGGAYIQPAAITSVAAIMATDNFASGSIMKVYGLS